MMGDFSAKDIVKRERMQKNVENLFLSGIDDFSRR